MSPDGAVCVEAVMDCQTIAKLYQENRPPPTGPPMCTHSSDCDIVREHCMQGLGGCWSWGSSIYSRRLESLARRWIELGCPPEPTCGECVPPEEIHCELGSDVPECIVY